MDRNQYPEFTRHFTRGRCTRSDILRGRRPLVPIAAAFAIGVALAPSFGRGGFAALPGVLLALSPPLAPVAFLCAGVVAGTAVRPAKVATPGSRTIEGRIASVPERVERGARFELDLPSGERVELVAPEPPAPIALGDRVRLDAELREPGGPRNPGGSDRRARMQARGIALEGFGRAPPIRIAAPSRLGAIERARDRFAAAVDAALPPREAALVRALGSGDRSAVDPATADAFARSGLAHLLSVSGLHLAVVAYGLFRVLRRLLLRFERLPLEPRRAAALVAVPATVLYAVATGADVPIVRSALAASAAFLGILLDREGEAVNTIALAALAVLAAEPGAMLDPSFQLSFAAVLGLALLTTPLRVAVPLPRPGPRGGWRTLPRRALDGLLLGGCASAAATIATAPIVAVHFRRLGLLAVPANLVGVPLGALLTILAALAAVAAAISPGLAAPLLWLCGPLARLLLWVNDAFAAPRAASIGLASPGLWGSALFFAALFGALRFRRLRRAACVLAAVAALVLPGPLRALAHLRRHELEVTFASVGQGDATVLRLPDGTAMLVDAGGEAHGRYDPGARDVLPFLRDLGVRRLEAAFISHPHPDHLLGLPAIAEGMPIDHLYATGRRGDALAEAAWARLPAVTPIRAGFVLERAGVRIEALGPPPGFEAFGENDASAVLLVEHGEVRFLLAGDVEAEGEAALLEHAERLRAEVVKVPHHGSRTSSSPPFVAATGARYAILCVGRANRFGFPHPEVVERWREAGAETFRTDEGAVRFVSDGHRVRRTEADDSLSLSALLAFPGSPDPRPHSN